MPPANSITEAMENNVIASEDPCNEPQDNTKEEKKADTYISRYKNDFTELEEIGRGGFGIVYKALHKLDGNTYAIKKIALSKHDDEENRRIRREITYMSSLQYQYIVRYFQTWIEHETDPLEIEKFPDDDDDSYDSSDDEQSEDYLYRTKMARQMKKQRSSSAQKITSGLTKDSRSINTSERPAFLHLQAQGVNDFKGVGNETAGAPKKSRPRANTD